MSDYQAQIDAERAETEAVVLAFVDKLRAVDLPGWEVQPFERLNSGHFPGVVKFCHAESGGAFVVTTPAGYRARNGKVGAYAVWPRGENNQAQSASDWQLVSYSETDPYRIGFSHAKTAKAIAADLKRRLVGGIVAAMPEINRKVAVQQASRAAVDVEIAALSEAFTNAKVRDETYFGAQVFFAGGEARLSRYTYADTEGQAESKVTLELANLTVAQTLAIAKLIS